MCRSRTKTGHARLPISVFFLVCSNFNLYRFVSERGLKFMFAICHRPSVCRLSSVTFVRPTQMIEIFGNVSTP